MDERSPSPSIARPAPPGTTCRAPSRDDQTLGRTGGRHFHPAALAALPCLAWLATPDLQALFLLDENARLAKPLLQALFSQSLLLLPLVLAPRRLTLAFYAPLSFLVALENAHLARLGGPTTSEVWATALRTHPAEVLELLPLLAVPLAAATAALSVHLLLARAWRPPAIRGAWRAAFALCVAVQILLTVVRDVRSIQSPGLAGGQLAALVGDLQAIRLERCQPAGIAIRIWNAAAGVRTMRRLASERWALDTQARRVAWASGPEAYILVVGESTRRDHLQVFGYARPTTPRLARRSGLLLVPEAFAPANLTHLSVPQLLAGAPAEAPEDGVRHPSLLTIFRQAGFRTWWIGNQPIAGFGDPSIQAFAGDADSMLELSRGIDAAGQLDRNVLDPVGRILKRDDPRVFLVVHLIGCHWRYDLRHPPGQAPFQPATRAGAGFGDLHPEARDALVNGYDNAVREQDLVLDSLMTLLDASGRRGALIYVADHGENLLDDGATVLHGKSSPTAAELAVPILVHASRPTASNAARRDSILLARARLTASGPVAARDVFHSLPHLAGIDWSGADTSASIFAPDYRPSSWGVATSAGSVIDVRSILTRVGGLPGRTRRDARDDPQPGQAPLRPASTRPAG